MDKPKKAEDITASQVTRLFHLAGLKPPETEAEREAAASDLKEILGCFQKIQEIDTSGVEPLFNPLSDAGQTVSLRADVIEPLPPEEKAALLGQAPCKEAGLIKTPPVLSVKKDSSADT